VVERHDGTPSASARRKATHAKALPLDRAALRRWASGLDDQAFASAVAALGVLLAEGATRGRRPRLPQDIGAGIPWDIGPIVSTEGHIDADRLLNFDASALAELWKTATEVDPILFGDGGLGVPTLGSLEIRTALLDMASLAWLTGLLAPVEVYRGAFVAIDGIGSGPNFRYPIRLGTLPDRRSKDFHARLVRHFAQSSDWLREIVEVIAVAGPAEPVDLLIVPTSLDTALKLATAVPRGIEAGVIVMLGRLGTMRGKTATEAIAGFAGPVDPWAVAVADVPALSQLKWIDVLLKQLSRDQTLDVAVQMANDSLARRRDGLVIADPLSLAAMRVRAVAARVVDALPQLPQDRVILPQQGAIRLDADTTVPIGVGRSAVMEALQQPDRYLGEAEGARTVSVISRAIENPMSLRPMIRGAVVFDHVDTADDLGMIGYGSAAEGDVTSVGGGRGLTLPTAARPGPNRGWSVKDRAGGGTYRRSRASRGERPKARGARSVRPPRPTTRAPLVLPPAKDERFIQTRISRRIEGGRAMPVRHALMPGAEHVLTIWVGPAEKGARHGRQPIDLREVVKDGERHTLRVVLAIEGQPAVVRTVSLPAKGASSTCEFEVIAPRAGRLRGRIIVQFRNRVLQTAIINAPVAATQVSSPTWSIETETVVRATFHRLSERIPFDLAIVHNHGDAGEATATVLRDDWVKTFTANQLDLSVRTIQGWLSAAAEESNLYDGLYKPATVELLRNLALQGVDLRRLIVSDDDPHHLGDPDAAPRIQVVAADPNAIFPIEFFYDFPPPTEKAAMCPNAVTALRTGRCDPANHGELGWDRSIRYVCPAGFWSMNRVIERHASDRDLPQDADVPDLGGQAFGVVNPARPIPASSALGRFTAALFAWSDIVERTDAEQVTDALQTLTKRRVFAVHRWPTWVARIAGRRPNLLVLLAHTDSDAAGLTILQIAKKANQSSGRFGRIFVRADPVAGLPEPGPVVLLLGCDTARAWTEYQSWVVLFKHHGAEIVVGTIASVAAKHAANVARRLAIQLGAVEGRGDDKAKVAFGDVLMRSRQGLLADGEVMSLALTSYGDSDLAIA
jgi:hypothetical protein